MVFRILESINLDGAKQTADCENLVCYVHCDYLASELRNLPKNSLCHQLSLGLLRLLTIDHEPIAQQLAIIRAHQQKIATFNHNHLQFQRCDRQPNKHVLHLLIVPEELDPIRFICISRLLQRPLTGALFLTWAPRIGNSPDPGILLSHHERAAA